MGGSRPLHRPHHGQPLRWTTSRLSFYLAAGLFLAARWHTTLRTRFARERTRIRAASLVPPLETLPPFAEAAMQRVRRRAEEAGDREAALADHVPFSRGLSVRSGADLWQVFFYRLVNPNSRRGGHLNAADRLRSARAHFVPEASRVVWYSPGPPERTAISQP